MCTEREKKGRRKKRRKEGRSVARHKWRKEGIKVRRVGKEEENAETGKMKAGIKVKEDKYLKGTHRLRITSSNIL